MIDGSAFSLLGNIGVEIPPATTMLHAPHLYAAYTSVCSFELGMNHPFPTLAVPSALYPMYLNRRKSQFPVSQCLSAGAYGSHKFLAFLCTAVRLIAPPSQNFLLRKISHDTFYFVKSVNELVELRASPVETRPVGTWI